MKNIKYITIALCGAFVLFFALWCFLVPTPDYSAGERRQLASFPEISWQSLSSGKFAKEFEEYTTDRFPLRESWRSIKAYARFHLFCQQENNDIFVKDGHIAKLEYPLHPEMQDYAATLIERVYQQHLTQNNVYFAMIPDKNNYLSDLKIDYGYLEQDMAARLDFCKPIQLSHLLSAQDYYYTDSHWRQECIVDVADHLAAAMGVTLPHEYKTNTLDVDFYGVYAGQSALKHAPDTIRYLTNETIDALEVTGATVYDTSKATSRDPYEFFLSGNQPLITIRNPHHTEGKRLILFRDSFASSLAPLLAQGYGEVVMVDLRYMNSALLEQMVDFENADVLFLYSAGLLNHSTSMK